MVANPMQKRARNSFLLGMTLSFIVCALIGLLVFFMISSHDKAKQEEEGVLTYAYKLKTSVMSGEEITLDKVESVLVTEKAVPTGAFASKIQNTQTKEWTDRVFPSGYKSKLALNAGTILSDNLVYIDQDLSNDLRSVEYNMLVLPTTLKTGDYIDIRLTLPDGQDLIVVSKKQIKTLLGNTIGLELNEEEILMMESAIVEAYIMSSSKLYAIQYVEPGMQNAAEKTYIPTHQVQVLMSRNSNITNEAREALVGRFNNDINKDLRKMINSNLNSYNEETKENIEKGIQKEIEDSKAAREAYLSGLTSY